MKEISEKINPKKKILKKSEPLEELSKKSKKSEKYMIEFRKAYKYMYEEKTSMSGAAKYFGLDRKAFIKNVRKFEELYGRNLSALRSLTLQSDGRPPYLDEFQLRVLKIFAGTVECIGYPATCTLMRGVVHGLRAKQLNLTVDKVKVPEKRMVEKILKDHTTLKMVRDSPNAARDSKVTRKYLVPHFNLLSRLEATFAFRAEDKWNCDEVGIRPAGMRFQVFSNRDVIRRNLQVSGHISVMLTTCADGTQMKPFVIWQGKEVK